MRIKLIGVRDPDNDLLNYYLQKPDVEISALDHTLPLEACIHQIENERSKLKDVIKQATQLRSEFEVDLATAVIEHTHALFRQGEDYGRSEKDQCIEKALKSRYNRRTSKKSWCNLGRHIRGHTKPNSLNRSKLTIVEVPVDKP
jgi:hypothetical protein